MTTLKTKNTISSTVVAFKIAMDRAFELGLTPDQFIESMMSEKGKEKFLKLAKSCYNHLEGKN